MTTSRHESGPLRPRRRSTADRIFATGLATAACVGLVGVIGVRAIEQSAAATTTSDSGVPTSLEPTTASGLTQADLEAYASQLQSQSVQLDAYRAKLVKLAKQLTKQAYSTGQPATSSPAAGSSSTSTTTVPKPVTKPKPATKPAPKPVAKPAPASKPASSTKSS